MNNFVTLEFTVRIVASQQKSGGAKGGGYSTYVRRHILRPRLIRLMDPAVTRGPADGVVAAVFRRRTHPE